MDSIKLEPYTYIHILDLNTNLTRLEEGPKTLFRLDHEEIVLAPQKMVKLPPTSYVVIGNPVILDAHKKVSVNPDGTLKNRFGEQAIKTSEEFPDPFPLYPGEELLTKEPKKYVVAGKDESIQIEVLRDYTDGNKVNRYAGQIYQIRGPITYIPRIEETYLKTIKATTITKNQGLILKAKNNFTDKKGIPHYAGQTVLYTEIGSYIPEAEETIVKQVKGVVLDSKKALHIEALREFTDVVGKKRVAGEQWIITNEQIQTYIEGVDERIVAEIKPITLTSREYCLIENPYKDGKPQWGKEEIRIGERTFFLQPHEKLIGSIMKIQILDENDALILEATEDFYDTEFKVHRRARENWMVKGPREYIPHVSTIIKKTRRALALDSNEGVYIRDMVTGKVHAVIGEKVLLNVSNQSHL